MVCYDCRIVHTPREGYDLTGISVLSYHCVCDFNMPNGIYQTNCICILINILNIEKMTKNDDIIIMIILELSVSTFLYL